MVIHIAANDWTVCAVRDELNLGLTVGGPAPRLNLNLEAQVSRAPVVIEHANDLADSPERDKRGRYQTLIARHGATSAGCSKLSPIFSLAR
jgi:hypothetical protein